jgi:hypothetical protein
LGIEHRSPGLSPEQCQPLLQIIQFTDIASILWPGADHPVIGHDNDDGPFRSTSSQQGKLGVDALEGTYPLI